MFTEEELKNEEWRKLINYPGYSVSSLGRVRSDPHKVWNGKGWHVSKEKMLKPNTLAKGYYQVDLKVEKKRHPRQVHRLVAEAFIPNPNNYPQVNHINGIKNDNRVENLEWCTNSMNQIHAYRTGLQKPHNAWGKKRVPKMVGMLSDEGRVILYFQSARQVAKFFDEEKNISNLYYHLNGGKSKSFHGCKFKYL